MNQIICNVVKEKEKLSGKHHHLHETLQQLVLVNDDINTFDHVIEALMEVCGHSEEQAEQCALITHLKGKCPVHKGVRDELLPMKQQLSEKQLSSFIAD